MGLVDPNLAQYNDFSTRFKGEFRDYFFEFAMRGEDGKDYFLNYVLARMNDRDFSRLEISEAPLWYFTTPSQTVIQKGEKAEVSLQKNHPLGALKTESSSSSFTVKIDDFEAVMSPPLYLLHYRGNDVSVDLELRNLGTPFWFNQGKEEGARITPSNLVRGMEMFGKMEGSITLQGKKIAVKGVGIHEHIVAEKMFWMEFGWQDWMWFSFEKLYGLLFGLHGGGSKDGGLYLMDEKEYLVIRDYDIDRPKWAYSPVLQHHVPVALTVRALTDKGTLFLEGDVVRSQPWRKINKYIPAMTMPAADMEMQWKGRFTYKDGRTIVLENGKGGNEYIAVYNFAQSNP